MHIKKLTVQNFRALEDISVEFDNRVNVIVGPNAIGKTTVLESIVTESAYSAICFNLLGRGGLPVHLNCA